MNGVPVPTLRSYELKFDQVPEPIAEDLQL
jgi:hypothetical protein